MKQLPARVLSIDVLRAITMFLMVFVNDVAGVHNIPEWIKHTKADADGMGFSDVIFPAFLFIVGLSLPFALRARMAKGASFVPLASYVFWRSAALLIMGFFQVNLENYNHHLAWLPYPVYTILLTCSFFIIWLDYPEAMPAARKNIFKISGVLLLVLLAFLFKGGNAENPEGLKPHWWGILGIIGWAYLIGALVFLLVKGKTGLFLLAFLLFATINVLVHLHWLNIRIWILGDAASVTLITGGTFISLLYSKFAGKGKDRIFWGLLALVSLFSFAFGFFIRPYAGGISKIYATPAWVFICMGITLVVFSLLIYLVDIKEKQNWFRLVKPAGTSTLTCYLVPYLLYSVFRLFNFHYPAFLNNGAGGIIRSFLITCLVMGIVSVLEQKKLRLRV